MSPPSLAMVLCVRDEEAFLAANLAYHHALGVERAYVFLDRCGDRTPEIARAFPWVQTIERDRDPDDRFMSAYQRRCLDDALHLARAEGYDWLLHLDPDEFASGDDRPEWLRLVTRLTGLDRRDDPIRRGSLRALLERVRPGTEAVVLPPRDVIPTPLPPGAPFWRLHHVQVRGALKRPLLDPTTGTVRPLTRRFGHYKGKSIVRTAADVQAGSAHRWVRRGTLADGGAKIPTERRGLHYHFIMVDGELWLRKHRKFAEYPDHWEKGTPVAFPRQAWKEASVRMSRAQAREYFDRWIAVSPASLRLPKLRGEVVRDPFVERVLTRIGVAGDADPAPVGGAP